MMRILKIGIALAIVVAVAVWAGENASQKTANAIVLAVTATWVVIVAIPVTALFGWVATRRSTRVIATGVARTTVHGIVFIIWALQGKLEPPAVYGSYREITDADAQLLEEPKEHAIQNW